jgi:hypothetical protein
MEELLVDFFEFYLGFDWGRFAVSIRLALKSGLDNEGRRKLPDKFNGLHNRVAREVWYVEDPFDLSHNLAAKCTPAGRKRIWDAFRQTHEAIKSSQATSVIEAFEAACPKQSSSRDISGKDSRRTFLLKCRVNVKKVTPEAFAQAFADHSVAAIHFPQGPSSAAFPDDKPEAFIEFPTDSERKQAHTMNETYVSGWQLRLFVTSHHALGDAKDGGAQFQEMPGWDKPQKDEAESQDSKSNAKGGFSNAKGGGRWKSGGSVDSLKKAQIEINLQRKRVVEGVEQAEGYDELSVLKQRAQALGLTREIKGCDDRMRAIRETREASKSDSNIAAVCLRGLPFTMSAQDVLSFLAKHDVSERVADSPQAVQLPKANGRPTGEARIQMRTRYDAEVAQQALNNQWLGDRYIEARLDGPGGRSRHVGGNASPQMGPWSPPAIPGVGPVPGRAGSSSPPAPALGVQFQ